MHPRLHGVFRKSAAAHDHFRAPRRLPCVGAVCCAFLAGPWARSAAQLPQYRIAAWLIGIGVGLWAFTWSGSSLSQEGLAAATRLLDLTAGASGRRAGRPGWGRRSGATG
jgi:hypothetical protein